MRRRGVRRAADILLMLAAACTRKQAGEGANLANGRRRDARTGRRVCVGLLKCGNVMEGGAVEVEVESVLCQIGAKVVNVEGCVCCQLDTFPYHTVQLYRY